MEKETFGLSLQELNSSEMFFFSNFVASDPGIHVIVT